MYYDWQSRGDTFGQSEKPRKRATIYTALSWKMTCKDKASYGRSALDYTDRHAHYKTERIFQNMCENEYVCVCVCVCVCIHKI